MTNSSTKRLRVGLLTAAVVPLLPTPTPSFSLETPEFSGGREDSGGEESRVGRRCDRRGILGTGDWVRTSVSLPRLWEKLLPSLRTGFSHSTSCIITTGRDEEGPTHWNPFSPGDHRSYRRRHFIPTVLLIITRDEHPTYRSPSGHGPNVSLRS